MGNITKSGLLTVRVELYEDHWDVIAACEGSLMLDSSSRYLHPAFCACRQDGTDTCCDVGWLEEFVNANGAVNLLSWNLSDLLPQEQEVSRLEITGRLEGEEYSSVEWGYDYDERFEIESVKVLA